MLRPARNSDSRREWYVYKRSAFSDHRTLFCITPSIGATKTNRMLLSYPCSEPGVTTLDANKRHSASLNCSSKNPFFVGLVVRVDGVALADSVGIPGALTLSTSYMILHYFLPHFQSFPFHLVLLYVLVVHELIYVVSWASVRSRGSASAAFSLLAAW